MKRSVRVCYNIAGVLSVIVSFAKLFILNVIVFNLFDINDVVNKYFGFDMSNTMNMSIVVINFIVAIYFNLTCSKLYFAISRASIVRGNKSAVIAMPVMQMFLGSVLSGIFGLVGALLIDNNQSIPTENFGSGEEAFFDIKLSVLRLKELKESGQITEEEYYKALNKILEK